MFPRQQQRDYEFMMLDPESQEAKLKQHALDLELARRELFDSRLSAINERERIESMVRRGIRHKNKMYKFHERVELATNHLTELEENPLTDMLKEKSNEHAAAESGE